MKAEKCILVGYSDEQKGYKCYKPRTKQARVSRDVVFDESASWYLPSTPNPDSNLSSNDEVSKAEMPPNEPEIETREESLISLRLSGPNVRLSRYDQSDEEGLRARRKGRGKCRIPARIGTSPTPREPVTGLQR